MFTTKLLNALYRIKIHVFKAKCVNRAEKTKGQRLSCSKRNVAKAAGHRLGLSFDLLVVIKRYALAYLC